MNTFQLQKSYKNALEIISGILHGDALAHLSTMIESGVQKYDKFTKDLHVSFIKVRYDKFELEFLSFSEVYSVKLI